MKLIVLLFPSVDKLIRFRVAAEPRIYEMDLKEKSLFCLCNEDQVELAGYVYGAKAVDVPTSQN
jgi:hypothetical protein